MNRYTCALAALLWAVPVTLIFAGSNAAHSEWWRALSQFSELKNQRKYAEAERVLLELWRQAESTAPEDPLVGGINHQLGAFYHQTGRNFEAERFYKRALEFWDEHKPARLQDHASVVNNYVVLHLDEHRPELAEGLYAKYQSGWITALPPDDPEIASYWNNSGTIHFQRGDFATAEAFWLKAIALREKKSDPSQMTSDRTNYIASLNNLGVLYSRTKRTDRALETFTRILTLIE